MGLETDYVKLTAQLDLSMSAAINSAATVNIEDADGNLVPILGNVTITAFNPPSKAGITRNLLFISTLQITDNGSTMVLLGGNNVVTDPLDIAEFTSISTTEWRMTKYTKFTGWVNGRLSADGLNSSAVTHEKISTGAVIPSKMQGKAVSTLADTNSVLSAALITAAIFVSTPTAPRNRTTDTAANIIGILDGYAVGTWFEFTFVNLAAFDETILAGTGVTLVGDMVVNDKSAVFMGRVDSISAITLYRKS